MFSNIFTYKLLINGKVQGVGFRYWFNNNANSLNLTGYVKNLLNFNQVEAIIQGDIKSIKKMIEICKKGNSSSKIINIKIDVIKNNIIYEKFNIVK